jgi:hypothetical protein
LNQGTLKVAQRLCQTTIDQLFVGEAVEG